MRHVAEEVAERWSLTLGEPYTPGVDGYTTRATLHDGTPAVLKILKPHRENEHEADALALWDGDGAVRLLERDESGYTFLIERCEPGTHLTSVGAEAALDVVIDLLPRLWKPAAEPFHTLSDEAAWWAEYLPEQDWSREPDLLAAALDGIEALSSTQGEQVLLNQDLHFGNVLAAEREPWLVIDPKPLSGEREFAAAPIVRAHELGHSKRDVFYRFDRVTSELGLDRERARDWTIVQTVAWTEDPNRNRTHVETARWLLESR
jgi:streptomycin 6-kinase